MECIDKVEIRLDQLLVERKLVSSRAQAQRIIKEGRVEANLSGWRVLNKSSARITADTLLRIIADESDRYVSRGALKLKAAHEQFNLNFDNLCAIDVGQSTGGFTDYLLQHGCRFVLGIEVGHDQLAERLRSDNRVQCLEGYNARALNPELLNYFPEHKFDIAVMDVSFISQRLILPGLSALMQPGAILITLVKPQFELGSEHIGRGGIVRSTELYPQLEQDFRAEANKLGMSILGYIPSPIKGGDGNQEFILVARKDPPSQ